MTERNGNGANPAKPFRPGARLIHRSETGDTYEGVTHPLAWGYVACAGGSRAITKAELAELSTRTAPALPWNLSYPQAAALAPSQPVDIP